MPVYTRARYLVLWNCSREFYRSFHRRLCPCSSSTWERITIRCFKISKTRGTKSQHVVSIQSFDGHMSIIRTRAELITNAGERVFQIPGVCLQAAPFLHSPSPLFLFFALAPTFARLKHRNLPRKRLLLRLVYVQKHRLLL